MMATRRPMPMEPPKVTGISPNEGPPGTKLTIRGENLGVNPEDLVAVIICGQDCLVFSEWKSPSKIMTRTARCEGLGDVIVVTRSGGQGSCTVQFRGYEEMITPTKECALWVNEDEYFDYFGSRHRPTSPSAVFSSMPTDPLGLNSPNTGDDDGSDSQSRSSLTIRRNSRLQHDIRELFPDADPSKINMYGNIASEHFQTSWYLLATHSDTKFSDIKRGLENLRHRIESESNRRYSTVSDADPQKQKSILFLKPNVLSVVECLDALKALHLAFKKDAKEIFGSDLTGRMEDSIKKSRHEAHAIFDSILAKKDLADSMRNALNVLQRYRFLFNLPSSIERNILKGDYDIVINDYARAKSLFAETQVKVFQRVYQEVETRIVKFKSTLQEKLRQQCDGSVPHGTAAPMVNDQPASIRNVEEIRRLVRLLVSLGVEGNPAWDSIEGLKQVLFASLAKCRERRLGLAKAASSSSSTSKQAPKPVPVIDAENADANSDSGGDSSSCSSVEAPQSVQFIEEINLIFTQNFFDLLKLGSYYFNGDLATKESDEHVKGRENLFHRDMVCLPINFFTALMRCALLPQTASKIPASLQSQQISQYQNSLTPWPQEAGENFVLWLPHSLRCVINGHKNLAATLTSLSLSCVSDSSTDVLANMKQLIFDLKVYAMVCLFNQAADEVRALDCKETWDLHLDDSIGSRTQLPLLFESKVIEILQLARETVLASGTDDGNCDIFSQINVQGQMKQLAQTLLAAFITTLEKTVTSEGFVAQVNQSNHDSSQANSIAMSTATTTDLSTFTGGPPGPEERMLIVICNIRFTSNQIIPRLFETFERLNYPDMSLVMKITQAKYRDSENKVFSQYIEAKSEAVIGAIEPSMLIHGTVWYSSDTLPSDVSFYVKETLMNIIEIQSQVLMIAPPLLNRVMSQIVDTAVEEIARLYECALDRFTDYGVLQAHVDLHALQYAFFSATSSDTSQHQLQAPYRDYGSGARDPSSFNTSSSNKSLIELRQRLKRPQSILKELNLDSNKADVIERVLSKFKRCMQLQIDCFKSDHETQQIVITL